MRAAVPDYPLQADRKTCLTLTLSSKTMGFSPQWVWCPSPTSKHRTKPHRVPKELTLGTQGNPDVACKFTPLPPAVVVGRGSARCVVAVGADRGWHRWNFVDFSATGKGLKIKVDFEGHTSLAKAKPHVRACCLPGSPDESPYALLAKAMATLYPPKRTAARKRKPAWWSRPIYCGWGDQVGFALAQEGPGAESRALAYCIQGLYERWIARLEEAGIPLGTIIIDAGWSPAGLLEPNHYRWPDLRGFIDRQHRAGRHVLLWLATWLHEGLPDKWCIFAGGRRLTTDPCNAGYRRFLRERVRQLLSAEPDGYNADGFKIDQLAYVPTERSPRGGHQFGRTFSLEDANPRIAYRDTHWGWELLHRLQGDIYRAAKTAKPDALLSSSTVHPYFRDTFDIVRLHDTGHLYGVSAVEAMGARAALSRAALPGMLIDADNWIHHDYAEWLDYTLHSPGIGTPCLFYSERFVEGFDVDPPTRPIPLRTLRRIGKHWRKAV